MKVRNTRRTRSSSKTSGEKREKTEIDGEHSNGKAMWRSAMQTHRKHMRSSAGKQNVESGRCAGTPGDGNRTCERQNVCDIFYERRAFVLVKNRSVSDTDIVNSARIRMK